MGARIVVIETTYGSVDSEMDDDQYASDRVYQDGFKSLSEAQEFAREQNRTNGHGWRYFYRAEAR